MAPSTINIQQTLKVSLKTAISKLQFIQEKKTALAKQQRRALADLLKQGKETSATIKVENIIRDDIYVELLEYLELYCELLLARIMLITDIKRTTCDESLKEAVLSVIFAAPHAQLKEIQVIKDILVHKYGPEFGKIATDNSEDAVPEKIVKRCIFEPPAQTLKQLYLSEIAKTYRVPYSHLEEEENDSTTDDIAEKKSQTDPLGPDGSGDGATPTVSKLPAKKAQDDFDALKARFAALKGN